MRLKTGLCLIFKVVLGAVFHENDICLSFLFAGRMTLSMNDDIYCIIIDVLEQRILQVRDFRIKTVRVVAFIVMRWV